MDPLEGLRTLRRRWVTFSLVLALFLAAGAGITAGLAKTYEAHAQIFVSVVLPKDSAALGAVNAFTTARVQSYVSLVNSPDVTDDVVDSLGLRMSGSALSKEITADAPLDRVLINVAVDDRSAARAAAIANAVSNRFITVVGNLEKGVEGTSPVRLTLVKPAGVPTAPVSPRPRLNMALALVAGLLLASWAVRLRELIARSRAVDSNFSAQPAVHAASSEQDWGAGWPSEPEALASSESGGPVRR